MPRRASGRIGRPLTAAWLVSVCWLVTQILLGWPGVRSGGDTGRYLDAAASLLNGEWPRGKAGAYLGYDLFVALFVGAGLGPAGVVGGQVALSALAAYCLFRLVCRVYDHRAALMATLLYVGYPEIQVWNYYVLTESIFLSLAIISATALVAARGPWSRAGAALVVVVASTVRPHAMVLLSAALVYGAYGLWRTRRYGWLGVGAAAAIALTPVALGVVGSMLAQEHILDHYVRGTIIWGYDGVRLASAGPPPQSVTAPANPIAQIVAFAASDPGRFARLAGLKLGYEYLHVRPYYSRLHNALLLATLLPLYPLAAWGVRRPADPAARLLFLAIVGFQSAAIAVTFADWDGRHLLVMLPFIFAFSAAGLWDISDRVAARRRAWPPSTPPAPTTAGS